MKLSYAIPVLGALALVAALPDQAQAKSRSSFDISIGLGYSNYGGYHRGHGGYYNSGAAFRYSRGYGGYGGYHGYHGRSYYSPRYYAPPPVYRETYYYRPAPRYYDDCDYGYTRYYRPVYRSYYSSYYCD
jgi:hypothetical protein